MALYTIAMNLNQNGYGTIQSRASDTPRTHILKTKTSSEPETERESARELPRAPREPWTMAMTSVSGLTLLPDGQSLSTNTLRHNSMFGMSAREKENAAGRALGMSVHVAA